ncbi:MAG: cadmium-translocating P-type ATPase [Lachnospiraceae bacterium]|nr:cadmium-translocating P-type ATPase [Lachnospiraceae bacterium]MDD7027446.1 heavy metal translocating P-type ATPase [Lachnospiraceae bacterium]MDY5701301.1 heavy metal translocating P-type ATPase [Lachnospiraceae bacterium]
MSKKLKKRLGRILLGAAAFAAAIALEQLLLQSDIWILVPYLIAYIIIGGDVVKKAVMNISKGQIFDENFLMLIATVGAFFVGEYPEAAAVMLFYQVGEWFQSYAVNRSRKSIRELMDIRPDYANVLRGGEEVTLEPDEVAVGETIRIKPGEKVPLDGIVIRGNTSLDTRALTGESLPRDIGCGDEVISGCINLNSMIEVQVTKEFARSTVSRILDLVENASSQKAVTEQFITRFARYYTPAVVILATVLAVVPPIFTGNFSMWLYRALTFLVISCPCALVISIPLSFFGGLGGASKAGILIKGSNYLEILAQAETVVMDKTGTLTKGTFAVSEIRVMKDGMTEEELLQLTALAESYSNHPVSLSIKEACGLSLNSDEIEHSEERAGYGVITHWKGMKLYVGNEKLMEELKLKVEHIEKPGTVCHVAQQTGTESSYLGYLVVADEIKEDAADCVQKLYQSGVKRIVMLTGDREVTAKAVAEKIGIKEVHAQLLPQDKVDIVERLIREKSGKGQLIFVGDGINDTPVLARADIGIAMGGLGSDAAIEAADVVIMNDQPSKIAAAMAISRRTLIIVKQNIVLALGVKALVLLLAAFGMASMWAAVFADVGVAFLAILNSMRAMYYKA